MSLAFLIGFGIVGFCAYEVSLRVIDGNDNFIERVGRFKYVLYILFYGAFSAILAGAVASLSNGIPWQVIIAVGGGYAIPAGGRMMMATLIRTVLGYIQATVSAPPKPPREKNRGDRKGPPDSGPASPIIGEEIWGGTSPVESKPRLPGWLQDVALVMRLPGLH